jgi:DegV family protein with EDD domain
VAKVAIVTDSASDIPVELAAEWGVTVVPLIVNFGSESWKAGTELPIDEFYRRLLAPGAPFPTTAACSPSDFQAAFQSAFDAGAESVVCISVGAKLSGTIKAAQIAREQMPDRDVRVVDSNTATAALALQVKLAKEAADAGASADEVVATVAQRVADIGIYFVVETLEYLRRGGRISAAQAAIGSVLSVKPVVTVMDGVVETVDRPRTSGRARARLLELLTAKPAERIIVIHTQAEAVDTFRRDLEAVLKVDDANVETFLIGSSVAPHVGPGAYGAAILSPHS